MYIPRCRPAHGMKVSEEGEDEVGGRNGLSWINSSPAALKAKLGGRREAGAGSRTGRGAARPEGTWAARDARSGAGRAPGPQYRLPGGRRGPGGASGRRRGRAAR